MCIIRICHEILAALYSKFVFRSTVLIENQRIRNYEIRNCSLVFWMLSIRICFQNWEPTRPNREDRGLFTIRSIFHITNKLHNNVITPKFSLVFGNIKQLSVLLVQIYPPSRLFCIIKIRSRVYICKSDKNRSIITIRTMM